MLRHYFDHNATTPVSETIVQMLPDLVQAWGNPSSIHWTGRAPKNLMREARKNIAMSVGCSPLEIVFNSGASEGNNSVIKGVFDQARFEKLSPVFGRNHFMVSAAEHPSVMRTFQFLAERGAKVDVIPVSRDGFLDMEFLRRHLSADTALVSVMAANNETGTIFPTQEISKLVHGVGALYHCDAVQAFGKVPVRVLEWDVDFATFSAHKVYALKGTGFMYVKKNTSWTQLIHGGGQERHRRGGTENLLGIAALGVSASEISKALQNVAIMTELRDYFEARVLNEISDVTVTAAKAPRLPNTSSLVLRGCDGETMLMNLDIKGFAVSTGAACSSGNPEPSPVLLAMGLTRGEAQNSLRVSLGWSNTKEEVDLLVEALKETVQRLRQIEADANGVQI